MFPYTVVATVSLAFFHTHAVEGFGHRLWSYAAIVTSSAAYLGLVPLMGLPLLRSVVDGRCLGLFVSDPREVALHHDAVVVSLVRLMKAAVELGAGVMSTSGTQLI